ncbi:histidine kinase [Sphaerisporangium sp. NBC_01403]|uniref:sensor histidine kinase n=1 Tax=Sphaerisporangium sp. NBC_01403 TaxID=2903599 RepID=UPI00324894E2
MDPPASSPYRRSRRDWVVDTVLFLLAVAYGVVTSATRLDASSLPVPKWLFNLDQLSGVLGCAALWLRRRHPVGLAVALAAVSAFSELVAGATVVALFTVAVHRRPRTTAAVSVLSVLATVAYVVVRPEPDTSALLLFTLGIAIYGAAVGWGLFIHNRRRLVLSLRDRAVRAETEARLRAEQAQHHAREAIAREMHDVLGHRLSLLSVHAGALEFRPDAPAEDIARAAKVIRESAHQALQDLREVIGVLRAPVGELPQPTLADIRQLAAESVRAGMRVDLREETGGTVPDGVGRTAYRIVQEALTNARKHAPGAEVSVRVTGEPGRGLTVEVRNTNPTPPPAGTPAIAPAPDPVPDSGPASTANAWSGQGLVGLAERVALASGRLEHGPTAAGGWSLSAWLPWPA